MAALADTTVADALRDPSKASKQCPPTGAAAGPSAKALKQAWGGQPGYGDQ